MNNQNRKVKFNPYSAIGYLVASALLGFIGAVLAADCQYWFI